MENVYLLRGIISISAPLFRRGGHFVARFRHFFADGAKTEPKAEDLLAVEPLVCRVRVMWCKVVFLPSFQEQVIISTASFSMRGMYP